MRREVEPRCVITTDTDDLHVVVEGVARHLQDEAMLQRAVGAFDAVYEWPTRVVGNQLNKDSCSDIGRLMIGARLAPPIPWSR
jgi:hypothetical protein